MAVPDHRVQLEQYFNANKHKYDFRHVEGCGKYLEDAVRECLQPLDAKWGLLKYTGPGTKYNGHRIDSILYRDPHPGDTNLRSIDVIIDAETDHAKSGWGKDAEARYTISDWLDKPVTTQPIPVDAVPWQGYFGDASNAEFKRVLAYDYARRPQGPDYDVSVWAFRVVYTALMGLLSPSQGGSPLGLGDAVTHHRSEWCNALGVSVIPVPASWKIGDPVP